MKRHYVTGEYGEYYTVETGTRHRINVSVSTRGERTWDCTVELEGGTMDEILQESDRLVAELDRRYPPASAKQMNPAGFLAGDLGNPGPLPQEANAAPVVPAQPRKAAPPSPKPAPAQKVPAQRPKAGVCPIHGRYDAYGEGGRLGHPIAGVVPVVWCWAEERQVPPAQPESDIDELRDAVAAAGWQWDKKVKYREENQV